jgi:hypothetical protein
MVEVRVEGEVYTPILDGRSCDKVRKLGLPDALSLRISPRALPGESLLPLSEKFSGCFFAEVMLLH